MESAIRRLAATKIGEGVSWTAGWSAHELNNAERNDFDHIIVGLSDWAALSGQGEDVDKQLRHTQPPVSVTQDRRKIWYSAILKYLMVEVVMRCENKQGDIVAGKLYRVVGLLSYLVTEAKVIDQRLIEQVVDNICSDDMAYPSPIHNGDSSTRKKQVLSMYQNFHEFVALLAHSTLALTLVPAGKAFDTYFGATPVQEPETFYAATRWVTTRYSVYTGDVGSRPNQKVRAQWSAWYEAIRLATEGYSKKPDAGNLRLVISGRAALRTMEQVKVRMEREKANAKDGATKTA